MGALISPAAQAVPSSFDGLVQVSEDYRYSAYILNQLFDRSTYARAGARVIFEPMQPDPDTGQDVYAVQPGEYWTWVLSDMLTGAELSRYRIEYLGGDDLCWSSGQCGPVYSWRVTWPLRCMPESHRYRIDTYHNNQYLGGGVFRPSRFTPRIAQTFVPGPIEPKRTLSGEGQATDIAAFITDNQNCGQYIADACVTIKATVTSKTNGQTYFTGGEIGTGKFSSLGYNAVLNPGGLYENDTVIAGDTDLFGFFIARYQAQDHGALEKISFSVERPATEFDPELKGSHVVDEELLIAIPGLVRITSELAHVGFGDRGGCPHDPKPHWLTPRTQQRLITLADIYHIKTGRMLSLNDASLEYGGVIANKLKDISPTKDARDAHCHGSHRQGIDIDINSTDRRINEESGMEEDGVNLRTEVTEFRGREVTFLHYIDYWAKELGGATHHRPNSIHYRFSVEDKT